MSTQSKYNTLNNTTTSSTSEQLIFPADYVQTVSEHPGHVVVFEINRIQGERLSKIKGLSKNSGTKIKGAYSDEVSMNTSAAQTSARNKDFGSGLGGNNGGVYVKTGESIVLPIPSNFNLNDSAQWSNSDLGDVGRAIDMGTSVYGDEWDTILYNAKDAGLRTAAGALEKVAHTKVIDYIDIKSGTLANPYSEVLFRGMNNRIVPMQWTFVPKNAKEAELLQAIVHRFRFHQRPEIKYKASSSRNTSYLLASSTFDISFIDLNTGKHIKWLPLISTCGLTTIDANVTPNGQYTVTTDGQLSAVTLSLNFTELVLPTKENMTDKDYSY